MKIHLTINHELEETEVHIHAKDYNEQIERLMRQLQASQTTMLDGYDQQEIHLLKISDIYSIYAEDAKVFYRQMSKSLSPSENYMSLRLS
ncbi:hypothetical protein M5J14_03210 [Lysinibacillus sp. OL1_EC]|uniref:hypothetical protein n=1 Tax=Lysinibacillus sp. OL1_EC TaxID=2943493 RepID=UPI00202F1CD9|nr:hypothetical protein [Lysinibacillus sp. OL1_EC]MCM0623530.1 hypothetical protein [Lysinibacillus sp. OL1_EC]